MSGSDPLERFLPPVQEWFRSALGEPTPAQRLGWPSIATGQNTLILAPTGSGKTLAAFLACLDGLWRQSPIPPGVRVLYVSPLKALNNDIHRNLQVPLDGVAETAMKMGYSLPTIETAVRTGDTTTAERQRLLRRPPHLLITTPESLHLLLTSRARDTLRGVTHCIVDEIHALCPNKRGVFLALLLERLAALTPNRFVRIGLSATQRPLEEVARYLGGSTLQVSPLPCTQGRGVGGEGSVLEDHTPSPPTPLPRSGGEERLVPRPVTIVDAGMRKDLDLRVVSPVEHFGPQPEKSIWPAVYRLLKDLVRSHRSTIIFANNRRTVERVTAQLNEEEEIARAHHGSVSLEMRQQTEQALKEGRLPAVVATASLELGIDMGAVDLVCQIESPGNVARGLQRVGRAGHLVGQKSKGRLIPKMPSDLLEQAVLAREMAAGRVEEVRAPINCLDILAQQLVAMAAMEPWDVPAMYGLVRRAYPFRDLSAQAFETVLEMISGRYRFQAAPGAPSSLAALQPRVSWDRIHNRIHSLPGSQHLALVSGGTIPDTGQYAAYSPSGVRIGELDEEFIYERRVGDTFLLGTNSWRLERIEPDRVFVSPAEGAPAMVPFWRGEKGGRSYDLGRAIGGFLRELSDRLDAPDCQKWLENDYFLDADAARELRTYVRRQLANNGALPTDQTIVIEASRDQLGDWQIIMLSPLGSRFHFSLRLALESRLRKRLGYSPQCLHHDDGLLVRLADCDEPIMDLFDGLTPENVEELILSELADSALFALRFRQNAARALLLPRGKAGRRAPLWLQRLRGRDLLQVARRHPDFPIVAETFRECLHDHLDVPRLREFLAAVRDGRIRVESKRRETASPFAQGLLFAFTMANMYVYDSTEVEPTRAPLDHELLGQLVAPGERPHLVDPRAVQQVERRLRGVGRPPRTAAEMVEWLRRLGDLAPSELEGPMVTFLAELQAEGRAVVLEIPNCREPARWVLTEEADTYRRAFLASGTEAAAARDAAQTILNRFLQTHALVGLRDVLDRYPFDVVWTERMLREWTESGRVVTVRDPAVDDSAPQWSAPANLEQVQRGTLALLRNEIVACPAAQFAEFVLRWQYLHPATRQDGDDGIAAALARLEGIALPAELWEQTVLPARISGYQRRGLDDCLAGGSWTWACQSGEERGPGLLAFWDREHLDQIGPPDLSAVSFSPAAEQVLASLQQRGASFVADLASDTSMSPGQVRSGLWELLRRRLATNDSFQVIRRGEEAPADEGPASPLRNGYRAFRRSISRRRPLHQAEGRWSLVPWGHPQPEAFALFCATLLLHRYGVAARELAASDPAMPPWRLLYEVLSRMEWASEVRRGYFVEGLSGAQFALPDAVRQLQDAALPAGTAAPAILLHSLDPANLFGSSAAFDIPLLDGESRPFTRRTGNWLVIRAGRPVLLIEQQGRRVTALASASPNDVAAAVACLPSLCAADGAGRPHKLTVEEWNAAPVTTGQGRELLEAAGFVRDYQGMTLYAAWR
jgi:ATP-dependent Lhr-like helicase